MAFLRLKVEGKEVKIETWNLSDELYRKALAIGIQELIKNGEVMITSDFWAVQNKKN